MVDFLRIRMSETEICRFCLKTVINDHDHASVDKITRHIFDVCRLPVDFDICRNPIICEDCSSTIMKLLFFKSICVNVEQRILQFSVNKRKTTVDLRDVYMVNKIDPVLDRDTNLCRLCMEASEENGIISFDTLKDDSKFIEMWMKQMTEVDLNLTENPKLCFRCMDNVRCYFRFASELETLEEKINIYRAAVGRENEGGILLSNMREYLLTDEIGEDKINLYIERIYNDNLTATKTYKCTLCDYKTNKKSYLNKHTKRHKPKSDLRTYKCPDCEHETTYKYHLNRHRLKKHTKPNENPDYLTNVTVYKCKMCDFNTKYKDCLKRHMLRHRPSSELQIYKCSDCNYETLRSDHLKRHIEKYKGKLHINLKDVIYKCAMCDYKTNLKGSLESHTMRHEVKSEQTMYKCLDCDYETYKKYMLKRHGKKHKETI